MTQIAEYRDIATGPRSVKTVLDKIWASNIRNHVSLVSATPGWEPAGSMARWTEGYWAVQYIIDGAIHGRRYRTEQEARNHFRRIADLDA